MYLVFHPSEGFGCPTSVSQYHFRYPILLLAASVEGHRALVDALSYLLASCECYRYPSVSLLPIQQPGI